MSEWWNYLWNDSLFLTLIWSWLVGFVKFRTVCCSAYSCFALECLEIGKNVESLFEQFGFVGAVTCWKLVWTVGALFWCSCTLFLIVFWGLQHISNFCVGCDLGMWRNFRKLKAWFQCSLNFRCRVAVPTVAASEVGTLGANRSWDSRWPSESLTALVSAHIRH